MKPLVFEWLRFFYDQDLNYWFRSFFVFTFVDFRLFFWLRSGFLLIFASVHGLQMHVFRDYCAPYLNS